MTREERINSALLPILEKMREHGATDEICKMYDNGFHVGAMWADAHPHWISVDEELPKIGWTMSDTVVVTDGNGGLRLAWYHQDEGWHFATGLPFEPTHWMPLPQAPVLSKLENTGKNHLIDANNMIDHIADVSKKVEKGGEE